MFPVKKFDIKKLLSLRNPHILIIGKRGTGKTTLIKDILHQNSDKFEQNSNIIFSPTDYLYKSYSNDKINIIKNNIIKNKF